jgi:hypothetical protein
MGRVKGYELGWKREMTLETLLGELEKAKGDAMGRKREILKGELKGRE